MLEDDFYSQFGSISLAIGRKSSRNPAKGYQVLSSTNIVITIFFSFFVSPLVFKWKVGRGCVWGIRVTCRHKHTLLQIKVQSIILPYERTNEAINRKRRVWANMTLRALSCATVGMSATY